MNEGCSNGKKKERQQEKRVRKWQISTGVSDTPTVRGTIEE